MNKDFAPHTIYFEGRAEPVKVMARQLAVIDDPRYFSIDIDREASGITVVVVADAVSE